MIRSSWRSNGGLSLRKHRERRIIDGALWRAYIWNPALVRGGTGDLGSGIMSMAPPLKPSAHPPSTEPLWHRIDGVGGAQPSNELDGRLLLGASQSSGLAGIANTEPAAVAENA